MSLSEYAWLDATALAELVADRQVTPTELARLAARALAAANANVNAAVETHADRVESLNASAWASNTAASHPVALQFPHAIK